MLSVYEAWLAEIDDVAAARAGYVTLGPDAPSLLSPDALVEFAAYVRRRPLAGLERVELAALLYGPADEAPPPADVINAISTLADSYSLLTVYRAAAIVLARVQVVAPSGDGPWRQPSPAAADALAAAATASGMSIANLVSFWLKAPRSTVRWPGPAVPGVNADLAAAVPAGAADPAPWLRDVAQAWRRALGADLAAALSAMLRVLPGHSGPKGLGVPWRDAGYHLGRPLTAAEEALVALAMVGPDADPPASVQTALADLLQAYSTGLAALHTAVPFGAWRLDRPDAPPEWQGAWPVARAALEELFAKAVHDTISRTRARHILGGAWLDPTSVAVFAGWMSRVATAAVACPVPGHDKVMNRCGGVACRAWAERGAPDEPCCRHSLGGYLWPIGAQPAFEPLMLRVKRIVRGGLRATDLDKDWQRLGLFVAGAQALGDALLWGLPGQPLFAADVVVGPVGFVLCSNGHPFEDGQCPYCKERRSLAQPWDVREDWVFLQSIPGWSQYVIGPLFECAGCTKWWQFDQAGAQCRGDHPRLTAEVRGAIDRDAAEDGVCRQCGEPTDGPCLVCIGAILTALPQRQVWTR